MGPFLTQQQQEVPSKARVTHTRTSVAELSLDQEKCKDIDAPLDVHIEPLGVVDFVSLQRLDELHISSNCNLPHHGDFLRL